MSDMSSLTIEEYKSQSEEYLQKTPPAPRDSFSSTEATRPQNVDRSQTIASGSPSLRATLRHASPAGHHSRSSSIARRGSFGSIREEDTGMLSHADEIHEKAELTNTDIPQTFAQRKVERREGSNLKEMSVLAPPPPVDLFCPCGSFQGWKQIQLGGRKQSKSYNDLKRLVDLEHGWSWKIEQDQQEDPRDKVRGIAKAAQNKKLGLEDMPFEILDAIFSYLAQDIDPESYAPRNRDLNYCSQTSRTLHAATLSVLYRHVTLPHSITFQKVMSFIEKYPALGTLVRRLDFSHYTSVGFGRTRQMSNEIPNVTPKSLLKALTMCVNLKEFQVHEALDDEINEQVLHKLFKMPSIHALDFCGCSSRAFVSNFSSVVETSMLESSLSSLKRLSLHDCSTIQAPVFEALMPRLITLTHLDVARTLISDEALLAIPKKAPLTHLNLGRCTRVTGPAVVEFLATHETAKHSLLYLNLMSEPSRYCLLSENDLTSLIPLLPSTLRSLTLGGSEITATHLSSLVPLTKHLEELSLAHAKIAVKDVNSLFTPIQPSSNSDELTQAELEWQPCTLRYIDLTGVSAISQAELFASSCLLMSPHSYPLEVIELGDTVVKNLRERTRNVKGLGWVVRELGRRGWFVRLPGANERRDDGRRGWKMGARWWGMRKVPVAVQEVGGMYGHYMFKS